MPATGNRVDAYIVKSAAFAQPILQQLRTTVHAACPGVNETIKWSFPNFEYNGSILCSMASFKQHCAFNFWLAAVMQDPEGILKTGDNRESMGNLGKIKSLSDLPKQSILIKYIKQAMQLIESGVKNPKKQVSNTEKKVVVPEYFLAALQKNKAALKHFDSLPYSHKKEYVNWITAAKTTATREKRTTTAIEWIAEGKGRNWKHEANL